METLIWLFMSKGYTNWHGYGKISYNWSHHKCLHCSWWISACVFSGRWVFFFWTINSFPSVGDLAVELPTLVVRGIWCSGLWCLVREPGEPGAMGQREPGEHIGAMSNQRRRRLAAVRRARGGAAYRARRVTPRRTGQLACLSHAPRRMTSLGVFSSHKISKLSKLCITSPITLKH